MSERNLFALCVRRCLCDDREQVQIDLLKLLERVYQKLALVGTEQQMAYFVDTCLMQNFQNVAFVAASSTPSTATTLHYSHSPTFTITTSSNVGMRKIKFLTQIADTLRGLNFAKIADLLIMNLANYLAVTFQHSRQPHAAISAANSHLAPATVSGLHLPAATLASPASSPHLGSISGGGTSPVALTSATPLSAFILPPATASIMTATAGAGNAAKPVYDACVTLFPDELLRLFARKMFADQAFEANYMFERLMALVASLYFKNQLHGKLNSMCRRKIFRGLSPLSASENGNVCFEYYFGQDGSEKAVHHESPLLKAFIPPNADYLHDDEDENEESELEKLCTDDEIVDVAAGIGVDSSSSSTSAAQRLLRENKLVAEGAAAVLTASNGIVPVDKLSSNKQEAENASSSRSGHMPTYSNQSSTTTTKHHPRRTEMFDVSLLIRNIITCINRERDWDVLNVVLAELPLLLRNHPLLISVVARAQRSSAATPRATTKAGSSVSSSPTTGATLQQQQQHVSIAALARQRRTGTAASTSKSSLSTASAATAGRAGSVSTTSTPATVSNGLSSAASFDLQNSPPASNKPSLYSVATTASGASKSESDDEPPHNLVEQLASALCQLCLDRDRSDPANFYNIPASLTRSAVHERVFPALSSMASCAGFIGVETQQHIIKCLEQCLDSRNVRLPLRALTLCLMQFAEMRMTKLLPSVLVSVLKISPSERNSTHMLEFLSNLVNLPHLYRNFVDEQFRSMFALGLPYTNPCRFSNYAVALAYVTLASWFLRSRVLFRKNFVRFIVKGLKSNLLMSDNAQNMSRQSQALALEPASSDGSAGVKKSNVSSSGGGGGRKESTVGMSTGDDSPLRRRTQSVNAAQYQRMKAAAAAQAAAGQEPHASSSSIVGGGAHRQPTGSLASSAGGSESMPSNGTAKFGRGLLYELIETFVDLMERHAFGNVVPQPPKTASPLDVFPPERLQSKTWLLGYRMVRITTLGPGSVAVPADSTATITASSGRALSKQALVDACFSTATLGSPLLSPRVRGPTLEAAFAHGALQASAATAAELHPSLNRRATVDVSLAGTPTGGSLVGGNGRSLSMVPPSPAATAASGTVSGLKADLADQQQIYMGDDVKVPSAVLNEELAHSAADSITNQSLSPVDQHFFYADLDSQYAKNLRSSKSRVIKEEGDDDVVDANASGYYAGSSRVPMTAEALRTSCSDSALSAGGAVSGGASAVLSDSLTKLNITVPDESDGATIDDGSRASNKTESSESNESNYDGGITITSVGANNVSRKGQPLQQQRQRHPTSPSSQQQQQQQLTPAWLLVQQQRQLNAAASLLSASSWVLIHVRTATGVTQWTMKMDNYFLFSLPSLQGVEQDTTNDSAFSSAGDSSAGGGYPSLAWPLSGTHVGTADGMFTVDGAGTDFDAGGASGGGGSATHYIDPAFVFLHLFCTHLTGERPLLLPKSDAVERAVKVLDRIHPYETHKIGVIYCAPHQRPGDEIAMMSNTSGSLRYMNFLAGLGELVSLASVDPEVTYTGGLDCSSAAEDGRYTYVWRTFLTQLVFHVTTLMPNRESDPKFTGKKLHIGNDFVNIIYNESKSGDEFRLQTLKGQFLMACVVVHPLALGINSVRVLVRDDLRDVFPHWQAVSSSNLPATVGTQSQLQTGYYALEDIVTDRFLPSFVRQTAMHLNLACRIFKEERKSAPSGTGNEYPFVSNWFERLRQLKRIRQRLVQDSGVAAGAGIKSTAPSAGDSGGISSSSGASRHVQYSAQNSSASATGIDVRRRFDSSSEVDIDFTDFL